ncbi:TonB-dependent receptor plug domain-containing protein [Thalassomonas sp. M1454]|uniref:TonB-dependent receptor plug domain-containing protein n=1 Tax=Thalassomonas sp. M1454 TaxID=2594477 RepID=UPI001180F6C7|nr:TonB-dependent receptor [Thalassomonas sp. M1454]TRX53927.1 TonB-dependent receptor [Thalassomonas sp. M1454]
MSLFKSAINKYNLSGVAIALSFVLPNTTFAAEVPSAEEDIEVVVVVGSRAEPRSIHESSVPVDVFDENDIIQSGSLSGEMSQVLHNLVPSFNFPRQSNSDTADLVRPAQLRGLSPDQTLVLVNGKRRHTTAILNTGGKTGRGSAPVDLNTIPMSAIKRIEVLRDGAAAQYGSDAIAGVINIVLKDNNEGGLFSATYGEHNTDFEPTDESITDGETVLVTGNMGFSTGDGFVNVSAQYRTRNATNRAGFDQVPGWEMDPEWSWSGDSFDAAVGNKNYKVGDPEDKGYSLFVNWEQQLTDDLNLYGFANTSNREATGSNFYRYPYNTWNNVPEVYPNGYLPENVGETTDNSLVLGVTGGNDWQWDLSANYGSSEFNLDVENSINASMGVDSPTNFHIGDFEYEQMLLNFDVVKLANLGNIPVTIALGAEYRNETYQTSSGSEASYAIGPFIAAAGSQGIQGLRPEDAVDVDRDAMAVYLDTEFEVTDALTLATAVRYEDYSDFGDTLNSKLSLRYAVTDNIALRGAASTGFRAPSLIQNSYQATSTDFGDNGELSTFAILPATDELAMSLGAESLNPEESENYSVGFSGNWDFGLNVTLDFYRIDIDDRITLSEGVFADENGTPIAELPGAGDHPGIQGAQFFGNNVDTRTEGFDLVVQYNWNNFDFSVAYNANDTEITNDGTTNVEEINTLETAAPDNKLIFSTNWQSGNWAAMLRATQYGETKRVFDFGGGYEPEQTYGSNMTVDFDLQYAFNNGITFAVGANNLLDEYPDESIDDIAYFGNLPYDVIPPVGMNGRYIYSRLSYKF